MKKRLYILIFLVISAGFVGCHKIDLKPQLCEGEDHRIESFEKGKSSEDNDSNRNRGGKEEDDQGGITDPNHDEDEDQQRRR